MIANGFVRDRVDRLPLKTWLATWRFWQLYHRYTVEGFEHIDVDTSMLIAGYHARGLAFDMCMLTARIHDELGYLPHGIVHRGSEKVAAMKWMFDRLGFVTDDGAAIREAVRRGEHIVVTPGAEREGMRSFRDRGRVNWGNRMGYLKLAIRHRLPIVPVAAAGADYTYFGVYDAHALGQRLGVPGQWDFALWLGLGPFGPYPFSPPFPVRLHQIIGEPIEDHLALRDPDTPREELKPYHQLVVGRVQQLLERAREECKARWGCK